MSMYFKCAFLNLVNCWMFPKQTERKYHFIVLYITHSRYSFRICSASVDFNTNFTVVWQKLIPSRSRSCSKLTRTLLSRLSNLLAQWRGYFNRHVSLAIVFDVKTDYRLNLKLKISAAECSSQLLSDRRSSESQRSRHEGCTERPGRNLCR